MKPKIVVIGTCRVHHPIRKMGEEIQLLNDVNQGFVHTTSEVVQRIKYLNGAYEYPVEAENFQLNGQSAKLIPNEKFENADVILIEISSRKIIEFQQHHLQLNNLMKQVRSFDKEVSEKWIKQLRDAWVENKKITEMKPEGFPNSISLNDRKVLSFSTAKIQSNIELENEINEINKLTKGKVIFVTHIDATPATGVNLVSRTKLIEAITESCQKSSIPFINPTELIKKHTQKVALEKNGEDIDHYNPEFLSTVGEFLLKEITDFMKLKTK